MVDRQGWLEDAPQLCCALSFDHATLRWAAEDFGHIIRHRPVAVLRPASAADIASMVTYARSKDLPVVARGQGHGTLGHAQAPGGVVIDMSSLCAIHAIEAGFVVVDAGARWSQVLAATLPLGLTPPVLTDYLELSVGGTLSVGGLGGMSQSHGAQTDCVDALEVVTPDGDIRTCSRTESRALFDAARAGKGRNGIITKAVLALIPAPEKVCRYKLACATSDALISNQLRLLAGGRFDYLEGQVRPEQNGAGWRYILESAVYYTSPYQPEDRSLLADLDWLNGEEEIEDLTYASFLGRMAPGEEYLRSVSAWFHPHPWCNLLLPAERIRTVFAETMRDLTHADVGEGGLVLVYPIPTVRLATPEFLRPQGALTFLFALLRTAPPDDSATLARMQYANRLLTERALKLGGRTYLG